MPFLLVIVSPEIGGKKRERERERRCQWHDPNHLVQGSSLTSTWTVSTFKWSNVNSPI
ncbi:hypothetical protein CsSME_00029691 [Camellia sinensis var. sinensis]